METAIHPFEQAGLGKAPFRYVGMVEQEIAYGRRILGTVGGCQLETKPGGSCAYCNQYIVNMFNVESADGNRFHVGCDCIRKVDAKLAAVIEPHIKKAKRDREDKRIAYAKSLLGHDALKAKPHPRPHMAEIGKTLGDYCDWLFKNAGHTGQLRAAGMVETAIAAY